MTVVAAIPMTRHLCPCCGQPMPDKVVPREELVGRLETRSTVFLRIVRRLAWRPGNLVTTEELVEYIWSEDADGGPDNPLGVIHGTIHNHHHRLWRLGWKIENCWKRWRLVTTTKNGWGAE